MCTESTESIPNGDRGNFSRENLHRQQLIELYRKQFGATIPPIKREYVTGFCRRRPVWLVKNLGLERIREEAALMEKQANRLYLLAAGRTSEAETRKLLGDLAAAEAGHIRTAYALEQKHLPAEIREWGSQSGIRELYNPHAHDLSARVTSVLKRGLEP